MTTEAYIVATATGADRLVMYRRTNQIRWLFADGLPAVWIKSDSCSASLLLGRISGSVSAVNINRLLLKKKKKVRTLPDSKKQKCARLSLFWGHLLPTHPAAWQHYIISQKKQKLAEMLHHSQFVRTDSPLCPIRQTETLQPHDEGVFSFWGNHNTILEVRLHQYIKLRPSGERGMKDKRERPVVMQRRTQKQTAVLPT